MKSPVNSSKKPALGSPQEWLAHAESDVNLARSAKDHEEIFPEQVCFHAQHGFFYRNKSASAGRIKTLPLPSAGMYL